MKKITLIILCVVGALNLRAQTVEKIVLKGDTYTVTKKVPDDLKYILGTYTYEWGKQTKEPIVELLENNTGYFQPHMVNKIPITYWLDCDENGTVRRKTGINGRFQVTLLVQYGDSPSRNYAAGSYDLMGVIVVPDENYAVILGERYKTLN